MIDMQSKGTLDRRSIGTLINHQSIAYEDPLDHQGTSIKFDFANRVRPKTTVSGGDAPGL